MSKERKVLLKNLGSLYIVVTCFYYIGSANLFIINIQELFCTSVILRGLSIGIQSYFLGP